MAEWISDYVQRIRSSNYLTISFSWTLSMSLMNYSLHLVLQSFQENYFSNQTVIISFRLFKEIIDLIPLSWFHKKSIQGHLLISLIKTADFGLKEILLQSPYSYSSLFRYKQCLYTLPWWVENITWHFFVDGVWSVCHQTYHIKALELEALGLAPLHSQQSLQKQLSMMVFLIHCKKFNETHITRSNKIVQTSSEDPTLLHGASKTQKSRAGPILSLGNALDMCGGSPGPLKVSRDSSFPWLGSPWR